MEQYEVFSTNRYTDPIQQCNKCTGLGSPIMMHLPSPTSNKNPGLQAATLQKRLFTRSDKTKVQYIYFLLYDMVQLQSFIRLFRVSYLSYHCLRNKQNLGIIKTSQTLALLTHLTYPHLLLHQHYPEINPLANSPRHTTPGLVLTPFQRSLVDPPGLVAGWVCSPPTHWHSLSHKNKKDAVLLATSAD